MCIRDRSNTMWPGQRPTSTPSGILIHKAIWPQRMGRKLGGCAPLGEEDLGSHLTQCGQGGGLPACQVSSGCVQLFGHNAPASQIGQDRQWSDSIGRTVLQTVSQKYCASYRVIARARGWWTRVAKWRLLARLSGGNCRM